MKLSVITTIYNRPEEMKGFIENMKSQIFKDYELIIVIDTNINNQLDVLAPLKEEMGSKMKIIYNTKRRGRTRSNIDAIKEAKGEYSILISTSDHIKSVSGLQIIANELERANKPTILELPILFRGIEKWNVEQRLSVPVATEVKDKKEIIALATPTHFSKVFKNKEFKEVLENAIFNELNTRFSFELFYDLLLKEKCTYATSKAKVIKTNISKNNNSFNPKRISNNWRGILALKDKMNLGFTPELQFACAWHISRFLGKITLGFKNPVMFKKQFETIQDFFANELKNISINNKYMSKQLKSVDINNLTTSQVAFRKWLKK